MQNIKQDPQMLHKMISSLFKDSSLSFKVDDTLYNKEALCEENKLWPLMVYAINDSVQQTRMGHLGLVPLTSVDTPLRVLNNSTAPLGLQRSSGHTMGARAMVKPESVPPLRIVANMQFLAFFAKTMIEEAEHSPDRVVDLTELKGSMLNHLQLHQVIAPVKTADTSMRM